VGSKGEAKVEKVELALERQNVVLMVLYSFYTKGREEVSLPEFLECIKSVQKEIPLKYEFFERFLYSPDLLEDLRDLEYRGFAHRFTYRHDSFIPKSYIILTGVGRAHAEKIAQKFPCEYIPILEDSVKAAIQSSQEMWRMYARPAGQLNYAEKLENC
jgi:hypothetical protein